MLNTHNYVERQVICLSDSNFSSVGGELIDIGLNPAFIKTLLINTDLIPENETKKVINNYTELYIKKGNTQDDITILVPEVDQDQYDDLIMYNNTDIYKYSIMPTLSKSDILPNNKIVLSLTDYISNNIINYYKNIFMYTFEYDKKDIILQLPNYELSKSSIYFKENNSIAYLNISMNKIDEITYFIINKEYIINVYLTYKYLPSIKYSLLKIEGNINE